MPLSKIQSLRVATVLKDFQEKLHVMSISFTLDFTKNPHSPQEEVAFCELKKQYTTLLELMEKCRVELEEKQTFNSLSKKIEDEKQMRAEHKRRVTKAAFLEKMEEELKSKRAHFKKLKDEYALLKAQWKEQNEKNQKTKDDKKDILQMLQKQAKDKEKMLEKEIMQTKEEMEDEQCSHNISMQFLQNQQDEMKQQRDLWEERSKTMRQDKAQQVDDIRGKINFNVDRLMEMRRKFRVMEQAVMEDKEEQEKLRQEQEWIKSAIKIQALWRGCMVRKGLGIYKKTEEDEQGKEIDGAKEGKKKDGAKKGQKK